MSFAEELFYMVTESQPEYSENFDMEISEERWRRRKKKTQFKNFGLELLQLEYTQIIYHTKKGVLIEFKHKEDIICDWFPIKNVKFYKNKKFCIPRWLAKRKRFDIDWLNNYADYKVG